MNKQETCIASSVVTAREANTLIPFSFDCNALFYHVMLPLSCSLSVLLSAGNCNTYSIAPRLFCANLQFGSLSKMISPSAHICQRPNPDLQGQVSTNICLWSCRSPILAKQQLCSSLHILYRHNALLPTLRWDSLLKCPKITEISLHGSSAVVREVQLEGTRHVGLYLGVYPHIAFSL